MIFHHQLQVHKRQNLPFFFLTIIVISSSDVFYMTTISRLLIMTPKLKYRLKLILSHILCWLWAKVWSWELLWHTVEVLKLPKGE